MKILKLKLKLMEIDFKSQPLKGRFCRYPASKFGFLARILRPKTRILLS